MKKKTLRNLAIILAFIMSFSVLVACADDSSDPAETPADTTVQEDDASVPEDDASTPEDDISAPEDTPDTTADREIVEVNVWGHDMDFSDDDRIVAFVEEKFGLRFNITSFPWGAYQENLRVELLAGNVPDMFPTEGPGDVHTMFDQLYSEGLIMDMTDLIPQYPNLYRNMHYDVDMLYALQSGDRIYGVPRIWNKNTTDRVFMIRKDWLDMLGLDMPATWQDLHDVLLAFQEARPHDQDQVGLTTNHWAWLDMLVYPGFTGVSGWFIDEDGRYIQAERHPNRRTAVEFLANLYAAGLLDPEIFVHNDARPLEYFTSGRSGVVMQTSQYAAALPYFEQTLRNFPDAEVAIINPLMISPDGIQAHAGIDTGYFGMWTFNRDFAYIERVLEMMDWLASDEGLELVRDGIEGIHFTIENGEKVFDDDATRQDHFRYGNVTSHFISYFVSIDFTFNRDMSLPFAEEIFIPSDEIGARYTVRNPVRGVPFDDEMVAINAAIADIVSTFTSQMVTGQMDLDQYDEMLRRIEAAGADIVADRVTEFMNARGR